MKEKGQSLIEAVIALGSAALVISAIAIIVIASVNNSDYTKRQNQATLYAQQGVEVLKNISESNWNNFLNTYPSATYCLNNEALTGTSGYCTNTMINDPTFIREVTISHADGSCTGSGSLVKVKVSWTDSKCSGSAFCHAAGVDSCFYDINSKPAL